MSKRSRTVSMDDILSSRKKQKIENDVEDTSSEENDIQISSQIKSYQNEDINKDSNIDSINCENNQYKDVKVINLCQDVNDTNDQNNSNINNFDGSDKNGIRIRHLYLSHSNTNIRNRNNFDGKQFFMNRPSNAPETLNNIYLHEIIPYKRANSYFFSSFGLEPEFLQDILIRIPINQKIKPITLIMHSTQKNQKTEISSLRDDVILSLAYPNLPFDYSSMHSKLWMFEMDDSTSIRIVVGSANMTHGDFEIWNQNFWIQDFPRKSNNNEASNVSNSNFEKDLIQFLNSHQTNPRMNFSYLQKYDFSTSKVHLIASVPGYHRDEEKQYFGHPKLRKVLENEFKKLYPSQILSTIQTIPQNSVQKGQSKLNFSKPKESKDLNYSNNNNFQKKIAFYQCSSIGSITEKYVDEIKQSLFVGKLHIIFPTVENVLHSKYSEDGAGCLFLKRDLFEKKTFPRACLMVHKSYNNQIAHAKHCSSIQEITDENNNSCIEAWCMIGSHNFSSAALGQLQKSNSQTFIRNYELSVLLPPKRYYNITKKELFEKFAVMYDPLAPVYGQNDLPYCN